ncbi:right-handed parallel beta-helix repeat-containing protein [Niabella aurantiaca]|uniref:right-handed parallel beta-helix repeat-containing protein n=1 Tax=Niabella aurantiaca TaxID=379900 RepID=UPI0003734C67|nr:right-handed parallel beta-helix repeat-containing protein [Niabella aurantiaca]
MKKMNNRFSAMGYIVLSFCAAAFLMACSRPGTVDEGPQPDLLIPEIWVNDVGAIGSDTLNDTWAFQKAIDSMAGLGGGVVRVRTGKYYIDVDTSIKMKSNVTLYMYDTTRKLIAKPTYSGKYHVILVDTAHAVKIMGGMIIGERDIHLGGTCPGKCEQGYGIAIKGSNNVKVTRTHITKCWGDGMIVSGSPTAASTNVTLKRVVCDGNRRQGMSIFRVNGLVIDSCAFLNTAGTAPQDGIDIEPDKDTAQNITITNCEFGYNAGNGIEMNAKLTTTAVIKDITVQYNTIHHSKYAGYIQHTENVVFDNNTFRNIQYGPHLKANDCTGCTLQTTDDPE